ncbi:FHA domain-containing protein [Microbacterium thalli]|uniref:FHA domain-containing protein n=1 Tax=Microbacterium thalli TaxID=3027921 RepID=A0ABT5SE50_9MICO|nr:FHA domain-containing protein [Microbacterium thalli]MDD7928497.1 FHA domain-containing protein [Microbacterium thalli]MDD7961073.1 FHA domain-containing protein [Microbacterium thalli]MDN8547929.1 FHA domain-containing protein [Microbacterium thalli]
MIFDTAPLAGVPEIRSGVRALLTWDDGRRMAVYARTVFGRDPSRAAGAEVVVLRDETLTLSRTHFELVPLEAGGLAVIDRASMNGIVVVRADAAVPVVPGERTVLRSGDRLELGDRWLTVEVVR